MRYHEIIREVASTGMRQFFFGSGFDPAIKQRILEQCHERGRHCYGEAVAWLPRLIDDLGIPARAVRLCHGTYLDEYDAGTGHHWDLVNNIIFDPTAWQFGADIREDRYYPLEIYDSEHNLVWQSPDSRLITATKPRS